MATTSSRLIGDIRIRCLEIHDLIVSKLAAGRLKDYEFIAAVLTRKLAHADEVIRRIQTFPDPHTQAVLLARLRIATEATDVRL
jgi:predicted nucleotidyltransferase